MSHSLEPLATCFDISRLRPTQMTVGYREVERKREEWRERVPKDGPEFLGRHMVPVIKGPGDHLHLIDHHHLVLALHLENVDQVLVNVVADLSHLQREEFWIFMANRNWLHLYDGAGRPRDRAKLPKDVGHMADDPFRSVAGEIRRMGGCAKEDTPYSEFLWADFLRRRIPLKRVENHWNRAAKQALELARSSAAKHLPGWAGPSSD